MATIKDVAALAGVSTATVSRVLNRTCYVEPITLERVERAVKEILPKFDYANIKEDKGCWYVKPQNRPVIK